MYIEKILTKIDTAEFGLAKARIKLGEASSTRQSSEET